MRVLAVNTASAQLSIALIEGDGKKAARVIFSEDRSEPRDQGNFLLHTIVEGLAAHDLAVSDIDVMAAVTGPGSFTGIRIGLAALRGFALAANVKLVGVNSFDMLNSLPCKTAHRLSVIESWRDELYVQLDDHPPVSLSVQACADMITSQGIEPKNITLSGDAASKIIPLLPDALIDDSVADAPSLAAYVLRHPERCGEALPFYLREADVSFGPATRTIQQGE